jgi:hypothetical protein
VRQLLIGENQMSDELQVETSALHESGHAVIHHLLGNPVILATLCNEDGDPMVTVSEGPNVRWVVLGGFAGGWAHKLFSDQNPTFYECSHDFERIEKLLAAIEPDEAARKVLWEEMKEASRELVLANEQRIRVVADHLMKFTDIGNPAHSYGQTASEIISLLIAQADESEKSNVLLA